MLEHARIANSLIKGKVWWTLDQISDGRTVFGLAASEETDVACDILAVTSKDYDKGNGATHQTKIPAGIVESAVEPHFSSTCKSANTEH